jgi:hypothetical protein
VRIDRRVSGLVRSRLPFIASGFHSRVALFRRKVVSSEVPSPFRGGDYDYSVSHLGIEERGSGLHEPKKLMRRH